MMVIFLIDGKTFFYSIMTSIESMKFSLFSSFNDHLMHHGHFIFSFFFVAICLSYDNVISNIHTFSGFTFLHISHFVDQLIDSFFDYFFFVIDFGCLAISSLIFIITDTKTIINSTVVDSYFYLYIVHQDQNERIVVILMKKTPNI